MSAILSADDLNDFISPGVACIKPVETLPKQRPAADNATSNPYEVTTEDAAGADGLKEGAPAQISLTDCLACSGCVTSAEAVLVSLQSHQEVLNTLDAYDSVVPEALGHGRAAMADDARVYVASVSPQTRASLAALYSVTEREAGNLIEQLLAGPQGLKSGGTRGSEFTWVVDTNTLRDVCQAACLDEVLSTTSQPDATDTASANAASRAKPKLPILASACPGWICYAEKTHPHILPHLSRLKSPQALTGTLIKSVLSRGFGIPPDRVWHVAIMPCFDKKLEASREELTDTSWDINTQQGRGIRDVDCVITAREVVMLAETRGISLPNLPRTPVERVPFPDAVLDRFLFPRGRRRLGQQGQLQVGGSSGGYAYHILKTQQTRLQGSEIKIERGRNADVVEYTLIRNGEPIMKTARYYGFRNIQNLVRRLKPQKKSRMPGSKLPAAGRRSEAANGPSSAGGLSDYAYVEVMACPGGCTNGGGQIKASDVAETLGIGATGKKTGPAEQKEWLARVDEAYYSAESSSDDDTDAMDIDDPKEAIQIRQPADDRHAQAETDTESVLKHWASCTGIELDKLVFTSYRQVESDVGKSKGGSDMERVAGLASTIGGGW